MILVAALASGALTWAAVAAGGGSTATRAGQQQPGSAVPAPSGDTGSAPAPAVAPTPVATPSAVAGDGGPLTPAAADAVLTGYFGTVQNLTPAVGIDPLKAIAAGAVLDEAQAQLNEFDSRGWTLSGTPRLENLQVLSSDLAATPPTAKISVCVDSSPVVVKTADGTVMRNPDASPRALNLYTVSMRDGSWRIISHSFPDDPTC